MITDGKPIKVGLQEQALNHLKLLHWLVPLVVSVQEKAELICQMRDEETNLCEALDTCRKGRDDYSYGGILYG